MKAYFTAWLLLSLPLVAQTACLTDSHAKRIASLEPCADWTTHLGDSHQCANADGGSMGPDMVRREITQKVVTEGFPLPHKEYGLSTLLFNYDGTYQARKLHFTWYFNERGGEKVYLVYAEDSKGDYEVEDDGSIHLKSPDYSTCDDRKSGSGTIYPHVQHFRRTQPYRTTIGAETAIVFETKGWLGDFLGSNYWSGKVESRSGYKLPPFPSDTSKALTYDFEGLKADIYYGCLVNGFASFEGNHNPKITLREELRYEKDVDPKKLRPGTQFTVSP
ncbi:MAG: hypothetical protein H7318_20490 [Oligoflexus sp.]|nr:hypothetical protein [Oligoflexus sp.]